MFGLGVQNVVENCACCADFGKMFLKQLSSAHEKHTTIVVFVSLKPDHLHIIRSGIQDFFVSATKTYSKYT